MDWLRTWDIAVFRWINRDWSHPAMDSVMRFLSGNALFVPVLIGLAVVLVWRDRPRGLVFVAVLGLAVGLANAWVSDPLKHGIARPRPYAELAEVILRVGRGNPVGSMPSAHAMNCALMATVAGWYYRRTLFVLPWVALGVALSRVYNGAHYPTDVLVGMMLGVAWGGLQLAVMECLWRWAGPRWLPRVAARWPSLLRPAAGPGPEPSP